MATKTSSVEHWGSIKGMNQLQSVEDVMSEELFENLIKHSASTEYTKGDSLDDFGSEKLRPESIVMDCEVLYTVQLQRHAAALRQLLSLARSRIASASLQQQSLQRLPDVPPLPRKPHREFNHPRLYPLGFLPLQHTPFTLGQSKPPQELSSEANQEVLTMSVCALSAQVGWDTSSEEALGVFRDVIDDFLRRMTGLLRSAVDQAALRNESTFPDAVEQVFHTMGLGSIRKLHDYYQRHVLGLRDKVEKLCLSLASEYSELAANYNKDIPPNQWESLMVKQEIVSEMEEGPEDDQDVPELHFPSTSDGDLSLQPSATLQSGFEMLHSLERQQLLSEDDGGNHTAECEGLSTEDDSEEIGENILPARKVTLPSKRRRKKAARWN